MFLLCSYIVIKHVLLRTCADPMHHTQYASSHGMCLHRAHAASMARDGFASLLLCSMKV